ncbi:MAG: carboxymuconolactone decarboxylase family protein [Verrucomicrobiae bacterium]|nr:carboxymuconolactone decarboxylase family protein [Verrucomicrobiae bacterium]MCX7723055.1 carboxymuconolactone decarboxylase family protein [Verrucomicrobiae bacterium]
MDSTPKAFLEKFKSDVQRLRQAAPDTVKGFGTLFSSVMKDGALSTKQKELIALGIAVAQRCTPCIVLHVQKCLEAGNTPAEIIEAAGVAVMMQGGPAYTHLPVVLDALDALQPQPAAQ